MHIFKLHGPMLAHKNFCCPPFKDAEGGVGPVSEIPGINTDATSQESTGLMPNEPMLGSEVFMPIDVSIRTLVQEDPQE